MKKIKVITILLLSFMFVLGMSQAAFAESMPPVDGGTYTFDGNKITDSAGEPIDERIFDLEPGDDLTINFTYTNDSSDVTYWYMENTIVKTLEEASDAANGGYSYTLTDGDTVIFDSEAVGGGQTPDGIGEGLYGVNDAIKGDAEEDEIWFFIRELGAGQSGQTTLKVALDGESQVNSYEGTDGQLQVNYAVEKQPPGEDTIINNPGTSTKTGDSFNPLFAILALTAALLAILLAVLSYFKDRKDGEEA